MQSVEKQAPPMEENDTGEIIESGGHYIHSINIAI
jgi:hypothetical protein